MRVFGKWPGRLLALGAIGFWADVTCDETPASVARVIKAAIAVPGEDQVAPGSDFDGLVQTGFDSFEYPALTGARLEAGVSERQIRKIRGENMIDVLRVRLD